MSQRLGFHRAASSVAEGSETKGRKTRLFWVIYMLEKSLSLRLGRPSTIRDNDITIPLPGRESYSEGVVNFVTAKFIQTAQLQGRVYDEVYSPSALAQTGSTRTARAKALAVDVQRAHASETATDVSRLPYCQHYRSNGGVHSDNTWNQGIKFSGILCTSSSCGPSGSPTCLY